ncbi:MAG: LacI family DNA-binding transcriptional regulator [Hyphomicrobiaceae bacterium]|nr:LacI family DNA-binding transcriptional regulator [Hyphomicrobiaceae bacterium]
MPRAARRPTIVDVAQKAGVSKSTVSLVLQQSPLVRAETRTQVREAMADLGYVYNRAAANLRSANAGLIGLVINDLRNPFFAQFAISLQMALSARGYAAVIANTDEDPNLQAQVVEAMIEHGVSAVILSSAYGGDDGVFEALNRAAIPTMQVLRKMAGQITGFPFASPDYREGGRLATTHLLDQGAKKIAFVGGLEGRSVTEERLSGYLSVLDARAMEPLILTGRSSRGFGREMARKLEDDYPDVDGVLCFNDQVALGLLSGCAEIGRRVGTDFKVVGFDDVEEAAEAWPALTSVHCDIAGFGSSTAETVLDWLENGMVPKTETRTPVTLIVRDSSAGTN